MAQRPRNTEAELLESYRIALENAVNQTEIAAALTEIGYDSTVLAQGKAIFEETRQAYDANKIEDDETSQASAAFKAKRKELESFFKIHRKKAKVIFRNDELILKKLAINDSPSIAYIKWLEEVKIFYTEILGNSQIQSQLSQLAISVEQITEGNNLVVAVETARTEYLREVGESQEATKTKDAAFMKLANWMKDFYVVAKIALEDTPQLLESLGVVVKG